MYVSGKLMGGLGNWLFIMASVYGYAFKNNLNPCIYPLNIERCIHTNEHYEDTVFKNFIKITIEPSIIHKEEADQCISFNEIPFYNTAHLQFFGYFQNEKYLYEYKKNFISMLDLPNDIPIQENKCFIHVRRGDFTYLEIHKIDLMNYYKKAINYVENTISNVSFVIYSNDIRWCKEQELFQKSNIEFFENTNEVISLISMSKCMVGGICANSSFSWWGSYLNENSNKIVIMPNKWFNTSWPNNIYFENVIIMEI